MEGIGPTCEELRGRSGRLHNEWVGHETCMGKVRNACRILVRKSEVKR
jgi:hypothetical protein